MILAVKNDVVQNNAERAVEAGKLNHSGEPVPSDLCPRMIWGDEDEPALTSLPDLFYAHGYWIVSGELADVLRKFDLGGGALYPVKDGVFQSDRTTRLPGDFFTWIFGNTKRAFQEQRSPKARPMSGAPTRDWCKPPITMEDGVIAVSQAALSGPDVWVDPTLFKSIFVSGGLGDALSAPMWKALRLFRCPVA